MAQAALHSTYAAQLLSYSIAAQYMSAYGRYASVRVSKVHASHPAYDNQLLQ